MTKCCEIMKFCGSQTHCSSLNIGKEQVLNICTFDLYWAAYTATLQCPISQEFLCIFLSNRRAAHQYKNCFMIRYLLELRLLKQSPLSQRISSNVPIELCCTKFATSSYTAATCFEILISTRTESL